jgi:hypothetical protein
LKVKFKPVGLSLNPGSLLFELVSEPWAMSPGKAGQASFFWLMQDNFVFKYDCCIGSVTMISNILRQPWMILLLLVVACSQENESLFQGTAVVEQETATSVPATARSADPTATVPSPTETATMAPTPTAQPTPTVLPPTPTLEVSASAEGTDVISGLDCSEMPGENMAYRDRERGIAFCYPNDWIVDDVVDEAGLIAVSESGFDSAGSLPETLVLIYPHEMVADFVDDPSTSESALAVAAGFFLMIVEDGEPDEPEPTTVVDNGQEQTSIKVRGTLEGDPVTGLLMGYRNDQAFGMAITYLLNEDKGETAEMILNSVEVDLPRFSLVGVTIPIELDTFHEVSSPDSQPTLYQIQLEPDVPVLLVAQSLRGTETVDIVDVKVYDNQGVFVDQFDTGWMGSNGAKCNPETMTDCVAYYNFGFQEPDAIRFASTQAGLYAVEVTGSMAFDPAGPAHRLGAFDMRPGASMEVDRFEQELESGETFDYLVEGPADQPLMAYVRPTGAEADAATLSLALLDETGAEIAEKHNHADSGDPVFIYWVPRDDTLFTLRLSEVDDRPASYELTILSDQSLGRAQKAQTAAAYAEQYEVDIAVQDNGDLNVSETFTLTILDDQMESLRHTLPLIEKADVVGVAVGDGDQPYQESSSEDFGTFQIVEEDTALVITCYFESESTTKLNLYLNYTVEEGIQNDIIETYSDPLKEGFILSWQAIPPERDFAIAHAAVHVRMPEDVELHQVYADGATGVATAPIEGYDFQPAVSDELTFTLSRDLDPETGVAIEVVYSRPDETTALESDSPSTAPQPDQETESDSNGVLSLEIMPNWEVGEVRQLELTSESIDSEPGVNQQSITSRTPVELVVDTEDEDGYVLHWTNGETQVDSHLAETDPLAQALLDLATGSTVEYETDDLGVLGGVRNWEALAATMQQALDLTIDLLAEAGMSQLEIRQIEDSIRPMFSSKEQIEAFSTEEIQLYHLGYGWGPLELASPVAFDAFLPNPFGGEPFPSSGQLELVEVNEESGEAVLQWTQTLDPEAAREILMAWLTDIATNAGNDPPTESDLPDPFTIEDRADIYIDLDSGWLRTVEYSRKIVSGPVVREEITRIVDVSS